jgi:beta-phosphoglucomutase-like phosphatase (HAD superfamily)
VRIDGIVATREHLKGKPAPDTFLAAARALDVPPARAAVFEDALAGVAAGRAGRFGYVVGVDRVGQAEALREHGADLVVSDLAELLDHE